MLIQPNVMTIDKMYSQTDENPVDAIDMEFGNQRYRARIFRPLNTIEFGLISNIYDKKMKTITISCYPIDESGNRLNRRGDVQFNDDSRPINPEDEDDLERRFYGNCTAMWLLPKSVDLDVVSIDWAHPSFIGY